MFYNELIIGSTDTSSKAILDDIAEITSGKRPEIKTKTKEMNSLIPIVGASDVMGYTNKYLYNEPILVTGRVGTHGVVQRINTYSWPSDNTLVIKSNYYEFVYQILKRIDYKSLNRGSTQPLITQNDLKSIEIQLPENDLLNRFEARASALMKLYDFNRIQEEKLCSLRDYLLPKIMSGQIDLGN